MPNFFFTFSILILAYTTSFSQKTEKGANRITISRCGDSLITQKYELIIKSKKVYFITPFANYLHIKGGRLRTRVKINKSERAKIFGIVAQLSWSGLDRAENKLTGSRYYIIETFIGDHLNDAFKVSEELLPPDFKDLYNALVDK